MKRGGVNFLERLGEFADVVGGGALEQTNLSFGYPFATEDETDVLQKALAVLKVDQGAVKGTVEGSAPHGSAARIAGAASAVVRMNQPRTALA